jgi:hypothetical protein
MTTRCAVWGQDWGFLTEDLIRRTAAAPDDIAVFAASENATGRVISAAWIVFYPGTDFAGLWGGSTLSEWRKQGIYRALVAVRAQVAVARGPRHLQVDASDDSAPVLRRLGFQASTTQPPTSGHRPPKHAARHARGQTSARPDMRPAGPPQDLEDFSCYVRSARWNVGDPSGQ